MTRQNIDELKNELREFLEKGKIPSVTEPDHDKNNIAATREDDIAIVGMACRFPESPTPELLWENLKSGKNLFKRVPADRFQSDAEAAILSGIDEFDAGIFKISAAEASVMDPHQRVILQVVWEAFENAGYSLSKLAGKKVGVYIAMYNPDYIIRMIEMQDSLNPFLSTGSSHAVVSNRISFVFDLRGPSEVISTACSSALVALHHAVQSIKNGESSMAVVGGVSLLLTPQRLQALSNLGIMSKVGYSAPFDKDSPGEILGEGAGVVILKSRKQAERDGDTILGLVKAIGIGHHGHSSGSLTMPSIGSHSDLIVDTYTTYGIDPGTIGYIEGHGSGNKDADMVELIAFEQAYKKLSTTPLAKHSIGVGSVKGNLGFGEASGGIAQLIKVLLCLRHGEMSATRSFKQADPAAHLEEGPLYVVNEHQPFPAILHQPRRAAIHAYGLGGTSAHLILEECVAPKKISVENITSEMIVLSAKQEEQLNEYANNLLTFINNDSDHAIRLTDLAYTLQTGREAMEYRLGMVVHSLEELKEILSTYLDKKENKPREGIYVGQVKKNKDALAVFDSDEEMQEITNKWMLHGKYSKILDLWTKGLSIDWQTLYKDLAPDKKPTRISAPTYPFAKERYWINTTEKKESNADDALLEKTPEKLELTDVDNYLKNLLSAVLYTSNKEIPYDESFQEIGVDSILGIGLLNKINEHFKLNLPASVLNNYPTIKELSGYINDQLLKSVEVVQPLPEQLDSPEHLSTDNIDIPPRKIPTYAQKEELLNSLPDVRRIFLTGVTGVLGGYLLKYILTDTNMNISCLVRAKSNLEGKERIIQILTAYEADNNILNSVNERVRIVLGDVSQTNLGISENEFANEAKETDLVIHCAAKTSLHGMYDVLVPINVIGTKNMIDYALKTPQKRLLYISTFAVMGDRLTGNYPPFKETDFDLGQGFTNLGYDRTKFESEALVRKAKEQGLRWSIIRPGNIFGDSQNGSYPLDLAGIFYDFLKTIINTGLTIKSDAYFDMTPVDYVAKAILYFGTQHPAIYGTYHLTNPFPKRFESVNQSLRQLGYAINEIEMAEYADRLSKNQIMYNNKPYRSRTLELIKFNPQAGFLTAESSYADAGYTYSILKSAGITCPQMSDLMKVYINYCKKVKYLI